MTGTIQVLAIISIVLWILSGLHWFGKHANYRPTIGCFIEAAIMGLILACAEVAIGLVAVVIVLAAFGQM